MTPENEKRIRELKAQARNIRELQQGAINTRNATQYGRLERELEKIWREVDKIRAVDKKTCNDIATIPYRYISYIRYNLFDQTGG
jgi:hypothetical protein